MRSLNLRSFAHKLSLPPISPGEAVSASLHTVLFMVKKISECLRNILRETVNVITSVRLCVVVVQA